MSDLLPVDFVHILQKDLDRDQRPEDGLLHCSGDLLGSLRHSQLRLAGAPTLPRSFADEVAISIGTYWHGRAHSALEREGVPVLREVSVTPWLPEGWAGTADYLFWDPEYQAFVLADLKTQKGESFQYLDKEGAKDEHIWQVSAYYWALVEAGFELLNEFAIVYLPKNDTVDRRNIVEPIIAHVTPLSRDVVWGRMEERWAACQEYLAQVNSDHPWGNTGYEEQLFGAGTIAPPMERVQKLWWNAKQDVFDVKLVPHWSTAYCPYPVELCDCSTQGETKIGHWQMENNEGGTDPQLGYVYRKNYEEYEPELRPTDREVKKRYGNRS